MRRDIEAHRKYQREWARRKNAARPRTVANGRPSRATKEKLLPGQCSACRTVYEATTENFVSMKVGKWRGLSAECRICRNARFRQHYAENREEYVAKVEAYHKRKPEKKRARQMQRYAAKKRGTAAWADQHRIETIYAISSFLTQRTGIEHQVDHIYPIMGKASCGLHVPENMRVITATANQQKGNRPITGG